MDNIKFYRYEISTSTGQFKYPNIQIILKKFYLVKETPKGYWIDRTQLNPLLPDYRLENIKLHCIWIPKKSKKRYAYPTKEEAKINFIKRTEKRIKILKTYLYVSETGLQIIQKNENETNKS